MKKLLLLGGSAQQVVAIETAKRLGYATVLCDFLPDNVGQYHADTFYLVSTTDRDAVLRVAKKEAIDGVLAYASDPAAPTAAYVAEALGLPSAPLSSVEILCNKDRFRVFLAENGFHTPAAEGFSSAEAAQKALHTFRFPIIIKPVDSSGSKGATVLHTADDAENAIRFAFSFSRCKRIVIEEYIEKSHPYLIGGDVFVADGKIVLWGLMNCHRDTAVNPLVPVGKSYPPALEDGVLQNVKDTLQRLTDALHIRFGAMNVELVADAEGRVWPIDVGPRNGGNMIPDLLGMIFGVDVVEMTVRAAMGETVSCEIGEGTPFYATHNLHTDRNGAFDHVEYSERIRPYIVRENVYKKKGDPVEYFDNAAKAIGIVFLKFPDRETMETILSDVRRHITVRLEEDCPAVRCVCDAAERERIIRECDAAFASPVCERAEFPTLLRKITTNAEFLEVRGERTMGYAATYVNDAVKRTAYITLLAVHPDFQGHGVGHALLEACIRVAKERKMTSIRLEVRRDNLAAIRLYEAHGFTKEDGSGATDRLYMLKTL